MSDDDIGNDAGDDSFGCDTARNLAITYNFDNSDDGGYGLNPPAIGSRLLQTPLIHTQSNNDTAKLPYDTLVGYKLTGMSGFNGFRGGGDLCNGDPAQAIYAYNFMRGKNGCGENIFNWVNAFPTNFRYSGNACSRTGWYDSTAGDKRIISNMGPFLMNPGDTQIIVLNFMITREGGNNLQNVCALQSLSDSALKYYYNDFRTCIPIGIEPISSEIPQRFALYQNYPNPFNPVTKIRFSIPLLRGVAEDRGVLLKIYDILGKEIALLVNEELKPGTYEIEWDASNFSSGVYFYSLITENFTQTNKMVVLK